MKRSTKQRKQLKRVKFWLEDARTMFMRDLEARGVQPTTRADFALLVAMEQLVVYCEQLEQELSDVLKR